MFQDLLSYYGVSRQGYHQAIQRRAYQAHRASLMVGLILQVRQIHPGMGLKKIYTLTQPEEVGRDAFVAIGIAAGLRLKTERSHIRTTFSHPSAIYPNLLKGLKLTDVNQLWTSDITYYSVADRWYYLTFLMDVYSRRILGYKAADNMRAVNNVDTLVQAIQLRGVSDYQYTLIHHSDRGSQYVSSAYTELLGQHQINISMCKNVLENAHVERVHHTIKNQYLKYRPITNFHQLCRWLDKTVYTYNYERPHTGLSDRSPVAFESLLKELPRDSSERPEMEIFTYQEEEGKVNPSQLNLMF